jgi:8-oxo-dGTP pyrophosphatase MutT (NUDIX family)
MDGALQEKAERIEKRSVEPPQRPRDAATLIILDTAHGAPRILFGKRRMDQKFMPGKYVFPGGRVDAMDVRLPVTTGLAETEVSKLLKQVNGRLSSKRAQAIALAAVRETFEETGLLLGATSASVPSSPSAAWQAYLSHGVVPDLSRMTFLARAITPPGKPRRYDTRFFCVEAGAIAKTVDGSDGELTETHWLTLEEAKGFDLPNIQRAILEDLSDRLKNGGITPSTHPVPFYHMRNGTFRRDLLTADSAA